MGDRGARSGGRWQPRRRAVPDQVTRAVTADDAGTSLDCGGTPPDVVRPAVRAASGGRDYSFGAHAVEVEVDEETGLVRVVDFVAATDCGNLVNPALAESQVEGGAAQGIGYGLMEDLICEEGQVLNPHLATYRVPTATEMPPVRMIWVETDDPQGPYGAKGLGEMGLVPTAAAIANAVYSATGARVHRIPLAPERVLTEIDALKHVEVS